MGGGRERLWDPAEGADRRRRQRGEWVDQVLDRSRWLPASERALLETVYRDGRSAADVARLAQAHPTSVCRRIRRAVRRALDPRLAFVIAHRQGWSPLRRQVAEAAFVEGLSIRATAARVGVSYHTARRQREAVEALYREWAAQRAPRRRAAS